MRKFAKKSFVILFNAFVSKILRRVHLNVFWGNLLLTLNKSAGFLEDARFNACMKVIKGSHQYDAYRAPGSIAWRLHTLVWAAQSARHLDGDFVECGVFKGDMSWVITEMLDFSELNKNFYLYDTFAGFAEKYSSPEDFPDAPNFYNYANLVYSDENLYPSVQKRFSHLENVHVIRGVVPEVLSTICPEKIAFLHIDLNSPAAEKAALETLFDKVIVGGYIIFDDYGWFAARKQKDAIDAFFTPRHYNVLELPTGQGLVIKR